MNTPEHEIRTIEVVSDVVCPWCYIGKRQLEALLAELPADERPVVRWHPFQLNPELPAAGIDRRAYLEAKFGGAERAAQIYARVRAAGEAHGLALDFDRIALQPNTRDAHRLIAWAQEDPARDAQPLVEALFRAYFVEGRFVGDRAELARIAGEAGLDAAAARAMLDSDAHADAVAAAETHARQLGVTGVPYFVFDGRAAVSGAAGVDALREALGQAAQAPEAA
jgi:predicted DsbA family dithiol-disulfide isomerase